MEFPAFPNLIAGDFSVTLDAMTKPESPGADDAKRDDADVAQDEPQLTTDANLVRDDLNELSATRQIAFMLEHEDEVAVSRVEDSVELASETSDTSIDWRVVLPAGILVLATVVWGLAFTESFNDFSSSAFGWIIDNFGWAFMLFTTIFVIFVVTVAASKFGAIKLGSINEEPEFNTISWIAMMFAAGMGIGLMFFGAAEPTFFYNDGVPGIDNDPVGGAMAQAMFHWTLHPWAIYSIVGLAIAYSTFRVGRKQLLSSAFVPLIGEKAAAGGLGRFIDILSIFATVFGTACSLGLGALQIQAGLSASGIIDDPSMSVVVGIVLVLTLAFILSALSGVGKGIQYLSNANLILAAILAIFVFVVGPTVVQLNLIPGSLGSYLENFLMMAGRTAENGEAAADFSSSWTIFYWAWWVSWSPFVGMFLARISRGRSVREFCVGVLLIPSGVSTIWFAIFGGTAIDLERENEGVVYGDGTTENMLFNMFDQLPLGSIASIVAMVLLATFFITSADSASTVMGSMSQRGRMVATPWLSATWGVLTAAVGLTMLIGGGEDALDSLQSVTIVAASPFLLIIIGLMFSLVKDLRNDVIYVEQKEHQAFARKLARERRLTREAHRTAELKERRAQRLDSLKPDAMRKNR